MRLFNLTLAFIFAACSPAFAGYQAGLPDQVLRIPSAGGMAKMGAVDVSKAAAVTGILAPANGGTGLSSPGASGNILQSNGTGFSSNAVLGAANGGTGLAAVGGNGNVLTSNGTAWVSAAAPGGNPAGIIIAFAGSTCPTGYLATDGSAVSRTTYATLFTAIGSAWGYGDNATTFNLPDLRGYFMRGQDSASGHDPDVASRSALNVGGNTGDMVGSYEADMYASHSHGLATSGNSNPGVYGNIARGVSGAPYVMSTNASGGNETRPKNVNVLYCIKF